MYKLVALFLLSIAIVMPANACGNFYFALTKEGKLVETDMITRFDKNFNLEMNFNKLQKLEAKLKKEHNYMLLSDYSLCLLKLGKTTEALTLLQNLQKAYPTEYKIAANLGTAYELVGQNDSALKYIKLDMALNPHDHEGSEWIHVKVLETKLKLKTDPNYLTQNSVLNLSSAQENNSQTFDHLNLQVRERFPFTPNKDVIMASLMEDMGDLSANLISIEYAKAYYKISKEYYGNTSTQIDAKIKNMDVLKLKYKNVEMPKESTYLKEGMGSILGGVSWKNLIKDNHNGYKINWDKINLNTTELLSFVDLTKTAENQNLSLKTNNDSLNFVPEDSISAAKIDSVKKSLKSIQKTEKIDNKEKNNSSKWFLIGGGGLLIPLIIVARNRKRKKNIN